MACRIAGGIVMSRLRDSAVRLVNLFRRERIERELDAELQAYLELDVEENIRRGMAPKEARRAALTRLGGVETVKEECRDVQRFRVAEDLWRDPAARIPPVACGPRRHLPVRRQAHRAAGYLRAATALERHPRHPPA